MDMIGGLRENRGMRAMLILCLMAPLAACSGNPKDFGITGPGTQPAPVGPALPGSNTDTNGTVGTPSTGYSYGPGNGPVSGPSGYFNYN